jgi:hypothetical protein
MQDWMYPLLGATTWLVSEARQTASLDSSGAAKSRALTMWLINEAHQTASLDSP